MITTAKTCSTSKCQSNLTTSGFDAIVLTDVNNQIDDNNGYKNYDNIENYEVETPKNSF